MLDHLKLKLQLVMKDHVGTGNQTPTFWKVLSH